MKILLTTASFLGLSILGFAQVAAQAPANYDFNGDPIGAQIPTIGLAGDVWSSFSHGYTDTDGVAPYQCGLLVSPSNGFIYHIDEITGAELAAFPVSDANDSWLGFDVSRNLIITSNPLIGVIRGYTPGNSTPVFSAPAPTPSLVGAAWDSTRDEYVYCDWASDDILVLDPTTLAVKRTFNYTGTLNRMAGVAYDPTDDVYVVGDRDTRTHNLIDPMTGVVGLSYPTAGTGTSNPRGAALSSNGGIWTGDFNLNPMFEQEAGHGPVGGGCGADPGMAYCFGDATGASCPCSAFGSAGQGCANTSGLGATLVGSGTPSFANDTFQLDVVGVPGSKPGLVLRGNNQIMAPAGDGILCTSGASQRSQVQITAAGATSFTNFKGSGFGSVANAGSSTNFQFWYRDPSNPCTGAGFNFTNGWTVTYMP